MDTDNQKWSLTSSSTISIALAVMICGGAYWTGMLAADIHHNTDQIDKHDETIQKLSEAIISNNQLIRDNHHKIERLKEIK